MPRRPCLSTRYAALASFSSLRFNRAVRSSISSRVVSTPTSARSRAVSISSRRSWSSARPTRSRSPSPSPSVRRVAASFFLLRANSPVRFVAADALELDSIKVIRCPARLRLSYAAHYKGKRMFHILKARVFIGALAAVLLSGCDDIHDTTLPNGLRVIVKEDHRSSVVASMVWYKVGSVDEPEGLTGISHVLEHMMFQGTQRLQPNEFSRIIAENGGRENAFTTNDYTAYFQQLEKSRLPIAFELEADRMQNLTLDESEFKKEIEVVKEERRLRTEDQPEALLYERMLSEAYRVHPYHHPVIGWMEDLRRLTIDDLRAWYRRWYCPNNAVLVVVGDVKAADVVALAQKYFGPIPARPLTRTPIPDEPPQKAERQLTVKIPAQVPSLLLGYH